jgi:geranylgeranylglycerol-phosphate geranylgeranyltransferase
MRQLRGLYKLARPFNAFSGALAVFLGGYVAGTGAWLNVILAALVAFLVTGAGNAWNDYLDIEIDKINQPHRALPAGFVPPRAAVILSLTLTGIALAISAFINLPSFLIVLLFSIVLYIYSWKLKSTVLMGNLTVAITSAMTVIFGGTAAGNVRPTLWLAVIITTAILGREVLKTIADYEGDLRQQVNTIATVWGKRTARIFFYVTTGITVWVMLVPYLIRVYREDISFCSVLNVCSIFAPFADILPVYNPLYAYIVAFGVFPVVVYVMLQVKRGVPGTRLERLSQILKYDFLIWFVAVILGANG